jgi:alpha-1,3-mannosyltransferase
MKVLQITRQFPPAIGGLPHAVYGLSSALKQRGCDVDVVTLRSVFITGEVLEAEAEVGNINVHRLQHFGSNRYPITLDILNYLHSYDILHIHAIDFFVDFVSIMRWLHRKPIIVTTHGGFFHSEWMIAFKKFYFKVFTRLSLCGADAVICVSEKERDLFRAIVPANKLHTLMGVDLRRFSSINKKTIPGLLVGIGRISANKRIDRVISLLPKLAEEFPTVQLVWIGDDHEQLIAKLNAYAQELGVACRVHLVGQLAEEKMLDLLSQANLFISCSSYEGFGIAVIEAMSSGTVPMVTPVGVYPEVIQSGKTGFICNFEADDKDTLDCFHYALSLSSQQLVQMGQNAREAAKFFSWEYVVNAHISIYEDALSKHKALGWHKFVKSLP